MSMQDVLENLPSFRQEEIQVEDDTKKKEEEEVKEKPSSLSSEKILAGLPIFWTDLSRYFPERY